MQESSENINNNDTVRKKGGRAEKGEERSVPENDLHNDNNELSDESEEAAVVGDEESTVISRQYRKPNFVKKILFFCAGLEGVIVQKEAFVVEHSKYISIGLTVFYTAVLSGLSGGYAISRIFSNGLVYVPFGLLWSSIILNLDRLVIIGLRRDSGSGKGFLNWSYGIGLDALGILSRIVLACFIGFIVSEPLKLRLFKAEINQEYVRILESEEEEKQAANRNLIIEDKKERIQGLDENLRDSRAEISRLRVQLSQEIGGDLGGDRGDGPQARAIKQEIEREDWNRQEITTQVNALRDDIDDLNESAALEQSGQDSSSQNATVIDDLSFLNSMKAMHRLSENDSTIRNINYFITALFIVMEILPVFLKFLFSKGMYEDLLERQNSVYKSDIQDEVKEIASAQLLRENLREVVRKASETEKDIAKEKYDGILLEQRREVQAKLKRVEVEINRQAEVQERLNEFKTNFFAKIIEEADLNIREDIKNIGSEYIKNVSDEAATLINDFTEVYRKVISERMPAARQKAEKDAITNIAKFGDENRELIIASLNQISNEARKKVPAQVSVLSDLIVKDRFEELANLEEALNQAFRDVVSQRLRTSKGMKAEDYLSQADELIERLDILRRNATQNIISDTEENLDEYMSSVAEEASNELVNVMRESLRDYLLKKSQQDDYIS